MKVGVVLHFVTLPTSPPHQLPSNAKKNKAKAATVLYLPIKCILFLLSVVFLPHQWQTHGPRSLASSPKSMYVHAAVSCPPFFS